MSAVLEQLAPAQILVALAVAFLLGTVAGALAWRR